MRPYRSPPMQGDFVRHYDDPSGLFGPDAEPQPEPSERDAEIEADAALQRLREAMKRIAKAA